MSPRFGIIPIMMKEVLSFFGFTKKEPKHPKAVSAQECRDMASRIEEFRLKLKSRMAHSLEDTQMTAYRLLLNIASEKEEAERG